jgi:hypothetical protein
MIIHLEAAIPAAPERVYELLTNGAKLGEAGAMPGTGGGAGNNVTRLLDAGGAAARTGDGRAVGPWL